MFWLLHQTIAIDITAEATQLIFLVLLPDLDAFLVAICMHADFNACLKHTSLVKSRAYKVQWYTGPLCLTHCA